MFSKAWKKEIKFFFHTPSIIIIAKIRIFWGVKSVLTLQFSTENYSIKKLWLPNNIL